MRIRELYDLLDQHPADMEILVDVDDGISKNFKTIHGIHVINPPIGRTFLALDANKKEEVKQYRIQ